MGVELVKEQTPRLTAASWLIITNEEGGPTQTHPIQMKGEASGEATASRWILTKEENSNHNNQSVGQNVSIRIKVGEGLEGQSVARLHEKEIFLSSGQNGRTIPTSQPFMPFVPPNILGNIHESYLVSFHFNIICNFF